MFGTKTYLTVIGLLALTWTGCSGGHGGGSSSGGGSSGGTGGSDAGDINAYFASLPAWPAPQANSQGPVDAGTTNYLTGTDGKPYQCTTTPYSLTTTPQQIVTFNPNVDVLWPGALLQGGPLQQGRLVGLPITQRASLAVSIPTLLAATNTQTVPNPTEASVEQAIGQIINDAVAANVQPSSSISYTSTEAFSATQAALSLGVSVKYLGFSLGSSFDWSSSANLHTVMGYFVQNMFTVTVPEPEQPADFFSGLTQAEIDQQTEAGNLGPANLPVYVASVTYGRIMMFTITSAESTTDIQAALNASYAGSSGSAAYSNLYQNASTSVKYVTVGGAAADAEKMIQSGNPSDFFSSDPAISSGVPISYTLRNLGDNSIAAVSETTSYSVQTCAESAAGPGANIYILSGGPPSLLGFDFSGNSVTLNAAATSLGGDAGSGEYEMANGLAYDSKSDQLYVSFPSVQVDGSAPFPPLVEVLAPDGTFVSAGDWGLFEGNSLFYDPLYDRLYATGGTFGIPIVASFTPNGLPIESYFPPASAFLLGSVFDPYNQWLYVTDATDDAILVFHLNGTPVDPCELATGGAPLPVPDGGVGDGGGDADAGLAPDGGAPSCTPDGGFFPGLASPNQIAYDSHHDLLYVTSLTMNNVLSFHPNGSPAGTFAIDNQSSGIAYDDINDHLLVVDGNDGLLLVFNPDGTRVPQAPGAFSGLARPSQVVVRP
jgi:hypothetical protein